MAGTLASDSLTGAPEAYQGQAVEQEASNFTAKIASLASPKDKTRVRSMFYFDTTR
jgi:hypothetical protein